MEVPKQLLKDEIAKLLIERSFSLDVYVEEASEEEMKEHGIINERTSEIGWTAAGTRALADDIRSGAISIEDGLMSLTEYERKELVERIKVKMNYKGLAK